MGIRQSLDITVPEKEHGEKKVQNGAPNGHALSGPDLPDAVSLDVSVQQNSEPLKQIETNNIQPAPEPVPAAVVSVKVSPDPAVPAETITLTNTETPKPVQTGSIFNMFKKKNEPVIPEPEVSLDVSVQQNGELPAMIQTDNALPAPEPVPAAVVSVEVSPDPAVPAETITITNTETPKPVQKTSLFNRFKKKNELVIPEPEVSLDVSVQQNGEPPAMIQTDNALPTPEPVPAAVVSVEVSPDPAVPAETITITNTETPKPVQKPSLFNRFKKKNEPVIPEPEVSLEVSVQQNSEPPIVIETDNALPAPEPVPAAVVSVEVSPVPAVPAETITITNTEPPKPAQKPSLFNRFKKKNEPVIPEPEVSLDVSVQQNSELPIVIETDKALPAPEPVPAAVVSVEVSPDPAVPAETITITNTETPKPSQKPSLFNRFKKKNEIVMPEPEVSLDTSVQQNSETPAMIQIDNALPAPEPVPAAVVSVEVSPDPAVPAETITLTNTETPKPVQTGSFFKMFKKKNEPVIPEPEVSLDVSVQQNGEPPIMIETDNAPPAPEPVPAAVVSVEVSPDLVISITPANKEPPKPAQKPSLFNRLKKKNEPVIPEPEVSLEVSVQQNSEPPAMIETVKALPTPEPVPAAVVSVEVSPDPAVPAETITITNTETPKPVQKPSLFNRFKKKNELVIPAPEVSLDVSVQQNSEPPAMIETDNALSAPEPVPAAVVSVEVSPDPAVPAETIILTNIETPKPVQTGSFFKMFKKKNEPVIPEPEVNLDVSVQQNSEPPIVIETDNALPTPEPVPAAVISVDVSPDPAVPAETITITNTETPKPVQKPSLFNRFKKKNEPVIPEPEVTLDISGQQNGEPPAIIEIDKALPAPEPVPAAVVSVEVSPDPVISITPAIKEPPKPAQKPSLFNKFKKKNEPVVPEPEVSLEVSVQQNCEAPAVTQTDNALPAPEPVPAAVISVEVSPDPVISITPANKEPPKPAQKPSLFNKFKKKNEPVIPEPEVTLDVSVQQNSEPPIMIQTDSTPEPVPAAVISVEVSPDPAVPAETITITNTETPKPVQKPSLFNMFKKKNEPVIPEPEGNVAEVPEELIVLEVQTDGQKCEPPDIKGSTQAEKVPQGESLSPSAAEVADESSSQPEESEAEENPVMNFFKTLVSPTKATKEAAAAPDASKDQSQKETPSAPTPNVPEPMKVPPPPPPAPPKMESKAEPAIKKEEPPAAEAAAAAGKETPSKAKAKAKDSPFGKLFRPKALLGKMVSKVQAATASGASGPSKTSALSEVKEEAQPVEVQVDASKTSTLEAAAKPEPPPAPKPEEKKSEKKPSPFANLLKPKVLLGQVSSKIQAAASSAAASVSLATGGAAAEPKKEAPAAAPAVPDPAASAKAKEEPKPAATAAATAAVTAAAPDNKSVGSADNPSPSIPRKLEKRNSIQLFFKNLGQKRHSDAGVQTEAVAPEKAK